MRALLPLLLLSCSAFAAERPKVVVIDGNDTGWSFTGVEDPASFGELDGNGDGKVDAPEWKSGREQLVRAVKETRASALDGTDRDNSGKVSRYEAAEAKPRIRSLWQQTRSLAIAANDQDGDGKLVDKELDAPVNRAGTLLARTGGRVDGNNDHVITPVEVETAIRAVIDGKRTLFSVCDVNNDGQLSQKEINIVFDLLLAIAGP